MSFIDRAWGRLACLMALAAIGFNSVPASADNLAGSSLSLSVPTGAAPATCAVLASGAAVQPLALTQTFFDDFHALQVSQLDGNGKNWLGYYPYGSPLGLNNHTLGSNQEKEIYVYPSYAGSGTTPLNLNPFSYSNGTLSITSTRATTAQAASLFNYNYYSGMLHSRNFFSQLYGYFEINAMLPKGYGTWPAFWLLPNNNAWPPEIDVLEIFGNNNNATMTTHWKNAATKTNDMSACQFAVPTSMTAFHTYGALWTPTQVTYYVDRKPVARIVPPAGATMPMYMLIDLAMLSNTSLTGVYAAPQSATLQVKWVAAYAATSY